MFLLLSIHDPVAAGFRMRRGFKCGDSYCETNFMKWCDGKVDCPNDNADEVSICQIIIC